MTLARQRNFAPRPHKANLAEDKSMHDQINSDLGVQWLHAKQRISPRGRPEHVGSQIEVVNMKQVLIKPAV